MDKDNECNALRQVLEERCLGAKFRGDDIKKLVDAGYDTGTTLVTASKDSLDIILPTQPGVQVVGICCQSHCCPQLVMPMLDDTQTWGYVSFVGLLCFIQSQDMVGILVNITT
jgi:hypothetical protein